MLSLRGREEYKVCNVNIHVLISGLSFLVIPAMATNLEAAREVRRGHIDDSIVPGTVRLVDLDHSLQTKRSKKDRDIVLVPTPSDDPEDPVGNGVI